MGTQTIEIQIRTLAMHRVAEHGAAAHWAYKGPQYAQGPQRQGGLAWLQVLREVGVGVAVEVGVGAGVGVAIG